MKEIYLIDLEYVETRYTAQWKTEFPQQIADQTGQDITVIEGPEDIAACTTPGAFLNFAGTNIYKSEQVKILGEYFNNNEIKNGDHFVFADAWHPGILNLKYMLDSIPFSNMQRILGSSLFRFPCVLSLNTFTIGSSIFSKNNSFFLLDIIFLSRLLINILENI